MFDEQEPDEFELAPELLVFRQELDKLQPAAPRIDRDQLMWNAGRAAARTGQDGRDIHIAGPSWAGRFRRHIWPAATATMTAATLLLSAMLLWQRSPHSVAEGPGKLDQRV